MSFSPDDVVIRPRVTPGDPNTAESRGRAKRTVRRLQTGRTSLGERMTRLRIANRLRKLPGFSAPVGQASRLASKGVAGLRAAANPVVLGMAVLALGTLAATRYLSGRPLSGLAEDLNELLLGSADDDARAAAAVRDYLRGDAHLMRFLAKRGEITAQVRRVASDLVDVERKVQAGEAMIRRAFPINSTVDILAVRGVAAFVRGWSKSGGEDAVARARHNFAELRAAHGRDATLPTLNWSALHR